MAPETAPVPGERPLLPRTDREDAPELLQRAGWQISASVLRLKGEAEAALRIANERLGRQAEQLAASAALLQATLESTVDAVIAINLDGRVVLHNSRFDQVWRLPPGLLARGDYAEICAHLSERIVDKERFARTVAHTRDHPDNSLAHETFQLVNDGIYECYAAPQRIGDRCVGVVVNWRDVTERERVTAAVRAKEVAEQTARARSEFLARMSHELRTPLNAVIGFADLLQFSGDTTEEHKRFVGHIRRAGTNLLLLINDVLDMSRVDAGVMTIELADVEVDTLLADVVAQVASQGRAAGVQVILSESTPPTLTVRADRTRLRQVLLNLTSNAIKYNHRGGHVTLQAALHGATVHITVADDGAGMTAEQLGALYQPFNRLGREQGGVEGTGIGLVIARSLTELMGGRISVRSAADIGSSFVIELAGADAQGTAPDFSDSSPIPIVRSEVAGCVLYIDDDEVNRLLMESFLQHRPGIRLLVAGDGESGLRLARLHGPDLVLLDILLPGLDGFEILRRIRADESLARTPCVAVSAGAMPGEIESAMAAGFDHYLTKPLTLATVLQEIDRQLERHSEGPPSASTAR